MSRCSTSQYLVCEQATVKHCHWSRIPQGRKRGFKMETKGEKNYKYFWVDKEVGN
jgi:hypothetical protein